MNWITSSALAQETAPLLTPKPVFLPGPYKTESRNSASHRRIAAYLREVADSEVGTASDAALYTHVVVSDRVGRSLGLASEAAHSRWALLMLLSQGRIAGHEPTRAFLAQGGDPPDRQLRHLFDLTIAALREGRVREGRA